MSELEELKARLEAVKSTDESGGVLVEAEDIANRAIAIAEGTQEAFNLLADERLRINDAAVVKERDQARAIARQLYEAMMTDEPRPRATQLRIDALQAYEEYR